MKKTMNREEKRRTMTMLLTFRESVRNFYQRFQRGLNPLFRFLISFLLFLSLNDMFHYSEELSSISVIVGIAFICMWLPLGAVFFLSVLYTCAQLFASLPEIAIVYMVLFLLAYLIYIRLEIQTCLPILLMPIGMLYHIPYIVPILVGISIGPAGIIPAGFGLFLYFFSLHVKDTVALLGTASATNGDIQAYRYLLEQIASDKELLLMILVFSLVIGIVWVCYRMSRPDAWNQAIIIGGISGMLLFLAGGYILDVEIDILNVVIGFIIAVIIGIIVQFFKCVVDHARVEYVQFEDDEYYYYVKAVPKVTVAQKEVSIKRINTRKHVKNNDESVEEVK